MTTTRSAGEQLPLVVRRLYDAPRERVFAAWGDRTQLERWYTPEEDSSVVIAELDFRVGGRCRAEFGPAGETPYIEVAEYLEIDRPARLAFTTTLTRGDERIAETRCVVDFIDRGGRTELVMTEYGFDPAFRADREGGWGRTLDHLVRVLWRAPRGVTRRAMAAPPASTPARWRGRRRATTRRTRRR